MTVSFVVILIIACVMALLAKRLKLPYTVVLVAAGLVVSWLNGSGDANKLGIAIHLTPELLLQLFLPILLFLARKVKVPNFDNFNFLELMIFNVM